MSKLELSNQFTQASKNYKNYCIEIDLKNRYKTSLTPQEKKQLNKLRNLYNKFQILYIKAI